MLYFKSVIGFLLASLFIMSDLWGEFASIGIFGGYLAAIIIVSPMWYLNHSVGLIENDNRAAWVDMAWGIAIAGTLRDTFINGFDALTSALPTLSIVILGAIAGGISVGLIEKHMAKSRIIEDTTVVKTTNAKSALKAGYK